MYSMEIRFSGQQIPVAISAAVDPRGPQFAQTPIPGRTLPQ